MLLSTGRAERPGAAMAPMILVVDSDDDTRAFYRHSFALLGCHVVEASDGRDALAKAFAQPLALVVTEIALPFVDGFALCRILRRDQATAQTPILVLTAEGRPAHVDRARRAGADTVMVKPADLEQVVAETRRLLADREHSRRRTGVSSAAPADDGAGEAVARLPRRSLVKSFARVVTTMPPASPPALVCPSCDRPLKYEHSYIGGVTENRSEQWDWYACSASCGMFEYRQRTRKLRCAS